MKFMKFSLLILFVSIVIDAAIVFAYPSPQGITVSYTLDKNNPKMTQWLTKTDFGPQTYENISTYTPLTDPCPNCQVSARPYTSGGDTYEAVITTTGQTKRFLSPTSVSAPNDYRLEVKRFDFTLLETKHLAVWQIN